jgi:flagellar basal-body rod protein FlgF
MPLRGIVNTARSLSYYLRLQEVTANNLANANTDAFKADRVSAHQLAGGEHPVPAQSTDLRQGTFRDTGRPLDLGLEGPGFFVVRTERGERLTRGGSLRLDADGRLADADGSPLLDAEGQPVTLNGSQVAIESDGSVKVDGAVVGRLRVVDADQPDQLLKEGGGRYLPQGGTHAVSARSTRVRQGSVEEPNVNPLTSMVDLVNIQRAYSANIQALRAMDGVLEIVTNQVGKP